MRYLLSWLLCLVCAVAHADDPLLTRSPAASSVLGGKNEFLPVEQAYPMIAGIRDGKLEFDWSITPGYYLYRARFAFRLVEGEGARVLDVPMPQGEPYEDAFLGRTEVYRGALDIAFPLATQQAHEIELKSQGCADMGLCYPPRTQRFAVDPGAGTVTELPPRANVATATGATAAPATGSGLGQLLYMVLLALIGGAILNLMPCVFPVLSLKALSLAQKGGTGGGRLAHAGAYTAGVVLSFVIIAAVLLGLRQAGQAIGWGFHLQSPVFVGGLAYLFVAMGLGLSGAINIGAGIMGAGGRLAEHGGYAGSFFTGVLATVVASPCTAPFMGVALGYALTQPALPALLVFASLGLGMAAPFLLLCASPRLLARLPRPGPWMDGFKQFLAFPLYAAAIWLLWVLGKQSGVDGMAVVLCGALALGFGLWMWERARLHAHPLPFRLTGAAAVLLALAVLASPMLKAVPQGTNTTAGWEPYTAQRLAELRGANRAVFVNLTADWCLTCLANEKIALDTSAVKEAFERAGVARLKGDWTNNDPAITRLLAEHRRSGVPLYLYYPAVAGAAPVVLPQLLTQAIVIDALTTR